MVTRGRRRHRYGYDDDAELAGVLTSLRDEGLPFLNAGSGWPPGAVFADLRDRGLVHGPYNAIVGTDRVSRRFAPTADTAPERRFEVRHSDPRQA